MKKTMFILTMASVIVVSNFIACKTPAEKETAAESKVEKAQQDLKVAEKNESVAEMKAATDEEWRIFKNDAEAIVKNNEIRINALRADIKKPGTSMDASYTQRVNDLEMQNKNLRIKVNNYDKNHSDWESFKTEFNFDMNALGKSLKDFSVNNKK